MFKKIKKLSIVKLDRARQGHALAALAQTAASSE